MVNKSLLSIDYASTYTRIVRAPCRLIEVCRKSGDGGLPERRRCWFQETQGMFCSPSSIHDIDVLPQTKKKRPSRRVPAESEILTINGDADMEVDDKPIAPRARDLNINFVDDDELQAALTRSRRSKIHRQKKVSPEEIARKGT